MRVDRRVSRNRRNRTGIRLILRVALVGNLARIIEDTAARAAAGGSGHLRCRVDRGLVVRRIAKAIGAVFRHRNVAAKRPPRPHVRNERARRCDPDQGWRRRRRAGAQGRLQHAVIRAFKRRRSDIFHPDTGDAGALEGKQFSGLVGDVDQAIAVIGAAIIDPDDQRLAVAEIRYPRVAGHRQGGMGGGQPVHIKYFAIGGQPAVEIVAVPGCQPLLAVMRIRFGDIEPAGNDIGLANPVDTAALRHGLAERDDPGA